MRKKTLYILLIITSFIVSCSKENIDEESAMDHTGEVMIHLSDIKIYRNLSDSDHKVYSQFLQLFVYNNADHSLEKKVLFDFENTPIEECNFYLKPGSYSINGHISTNDMQPGNNWTIYSSSSQYQPTISTFRLDKDQNQVLGDVCDDRFFGTQTLDVAQGSDDQNLQMEFKRYYGSISVEPLIKLADTSGNVDDYTITYSIENIENKSFNIATQKYSNLLPSGVESNQCTISNKKDVSAISNNFLVLPNKKIELFYTLVNNKTKQVISDHQKVFDAPIEVKKDIKTQLKFTIDVDNTDPNHNKLRTIHTIIDFVDITWVTEDIDIDDPNIVID